MDESILMNYLRGGCNDEECQQVELWCEEAPENRQILEQPDERIGYFRQ